MRPLFDQRWLAIGLALILSRASFLDRVLAQIPLEASIEKSQSFVPPRMPSETQRRLRQLDALVTDKAWNDAFLLIDDLLINDQEVIYTPPDLNASLSIPLRQHLQYQLAQYPAEGIRQYRNLYDSVARDLYSKGVQSHNTDLLNQVVDDYFATSWADDAMLALGEIAFSSGNFSKARAYWQRINPLTVGPRGRPIDVALSNLKPDIDLTRLAEVWRSSKRPSNETYYRNSDIKLVDILSRLILCSIQEDDLERATVELLLMRALEPNQESWIAGGNQATAAKLEAMLSRMPSKKTTNDRLGPLIDWQWDSLQPVQQAQPRNAINVNRGMINRQLFPNTRIVNTNSLNNTVLPVVAGNMILINSKNHFAAWSIFDGIQIPGKTFGLQNEQPVNQLQTNNQNQLRGRIQGQIIINGRVVNGFNNPANINSLRRTGASRINYPWPGTLTYHHGKIFYATSEVIKNRNGTAITTNLPPTRILGVDPTEEGKRFLELDLKKDVPSTTQYFAGPSVIRDDRLYVVLNSKGARNNFSVACYSMDESRVLWKTDIGSGISSLVNTPNTSHKVIFGDQSLFLSTNQGAVIALDSTHGNLKWISKYPSISKVYPAANNQLADRGILYKDRFYTAPNDSEDILCFDANTGRIIWGALKSDSSAHLAAVTSEIVLLAGEQLESFDRLTGSRKYVFPEGKHSGIRGMGIGVAVGDEYFWPTRTEIRCIKIDTGSMSRSPISLAQFGTDGANLVKSGQQLVVVGTNGMNVLGDQNPRILEPSPLISHLFNRSVTAPSSVVLTVNQ